MEVWRLQRRVEDIAYAYVTNEIGKQIVYLIPIQY